MLTRSATIFDRILDRIGRHMAHKLNQPSSGYQPFTPSDPDRLSRALRPADVILIEGRERVSNAIKYLTQSTWSHAAIYVGNALPAPADGGERPQLIEVNAGQGCIAVPLSKYAGYNTRICRATGLAPAERARVASFMTARLGLDYDMRNIFDLLRFFFPTPPVPVRWRRRMIALGSGDPSRAICSSLIAQAFQSVRYPILPDVTVEDASGAGDYMRREVYHIRHHSLFAPRDFDLSPYFEVIKPEPLAVDFRQMVWADGDRRMAGA
jgi:hypothetical protein